MNRDLKHKMKYDVIIPVKNGITFVKQAIDSVAGQTLQPDQIFLVNDHSSDGTVEFVKSVYPSVTILNSHSHGQASALNLGISNSKNAFVSFLDSDDIWARGKQMKQVLMLLNNPKAMYSSSGVRNFLDGGNSETEFKEYQNSRALGACTFRKSVFLDFGFFNDSNHKDVFVYEFFYRIRDLERVSTETIELFRRIHADNLWIHQRDELINSLFGFLRERLKP